MVDITMCKGTNCPLKETCYRFTAPANPHWQSQFVRVPYNKKTEECEHYWENINT